MVIHTTALIGDDARLGTDVSVGAYSVVGIDRSDLDPVEIGEATVIRSHVVIYRGTAVGARCAFGHGVLVRENCSLGADVSIGSHSIIEHRVTLADRVRLHSGCFVPELSAVEEGAWLGPGVIVTNAPYPNRPDTKENLAGVTIGRGATIGAGAVLLPGIWIGSGALIGAGSVVVEDVPDGARIVGNPGRVL